MTIQNQIKSHKVQFNFKMRDKVKAKQKIYIMIYNNQKFNSKIQNCKIYTNKKLNRYKLTIIKTIKIKR